MRLLSPLLGLSLLAALPVAAQDIVPDPQCSFLLILVVGQYDRACTTADTSIMPQIDRAIDRYEDYFVRNSALSRAEIADAARSGLSAPLGDGYDCATRPVGTFHARFAQEPSRLSGSVDIHLEHDTPVALDFSRCFPGRTN